MRKLAWILVAFVAGCGSGSTTVSTSSTPPTGGGADGGMGAPTPGGGGGGMPGAGGGGAGGTGGGSGGGGAGGTGGSGGGGGGSGGGGSGGSGGGGSGGGTVTWESINLDVADVQVIWGASPNDIWIGPQLGHYAGGTHVTPAGVNASITALGGAASNNVYAGGYVTVPHEGLIYHYDGTSWTQRSSVGSFVAAIYVHTPSDVYFAAGGLLRSSDQGATTTVVAGNAGCGVEWVTGEGDEIDAVGTCGSPMGSFLFRSTNGGRSFALIPIRMLDRLRVATRGGVLYISGYENNDLVTPHLLRSADGGTTFTDVEPSTPINAATLWADSANELWAGDYSGRGHGIAHTTDGGATWTMDLATTALVEDIIAIGAHDLYAVAFDSHTPTFVFLHGSR